MKPLINIDRLKLQPAEPGDQPVSYAVISDHIGASRLGYNLSVVPPGKRGGFFHNHRINEEMFLILEGEGVLRFGDDEYPVQRRDVIACPPGGRDVAHQLRNTGDVDLVYLALSTRDGHEIAEFPDSNKVTVTVGDYVDVKLRHAFCVDSAVDYDAGKP